MPVTSNGFPLDTNGVPITDTFAWGGANLGAPSNFGTTPGAVIVGQVNASIFQGTAAISATNALFSEITDGTHALGAFADFGSTPGAVYAAGVNASLFSGTTALTNTGGSLNVNVTGGAAAATQYQNATTPYGSPASLEGTAALGVDAGGEVHVLNTDTLGNLVVEPAAPTLSLLQTAVINTSSSGNQQIIAGVSAKTIRIMEVDLQVSGLGSGSTTITFKDGSSTALTGPYFALNGWSWGRANNGDPAFISSTTGAGSGFVIDTSATAQLSGYAKYTQS